MLTALRSTSVMEGVSSTGRVGPFDDAVRKEIGIAEIGLGVCTIHRPNENPGQLQHYHHHQPPIHPNTGLRSRVGGRIHCINGADGVEQRYAFSFKTSSDSSFIPLFLIRKLQA